MMKQFTKTIAMLAAMAAAACVDDASANCASAYNYACENTSGIATKCPASCFKNYTGTTPNMPTTCEGWKAYTPGSAHQSDSCKDKDATTCSKVADGSGAWECNQTEGVARNCPASCAMNAWPKKSCDDWKTYYTGGGTATCHDDAATECVNVANEYSCMNTAGIAQSCPVSCMNKQSGAKWTCDQWKAFTPSGPTPAAATTIPTIPGASTIPASTIPASTVPAPTNVPPSGVPAVPQFEMPNFGYMTFTNFSTTLNMYAAAGVNRLRGGQSYTRL